MPDPEAIPSPKPTADTAPPDFDRGLFVADKPGAEFASLRHARIAAPGATASLFLPVIGLCYLLHLSLVASGVPFIVSASAAGVLAAAGLALVFAHTLRGGFGKADHALFHAAANTDTRYRLRVVIPRSRQAGPLGRWAMRATGVEQERYPEASEDLAPERGGFEPIIVRPWLGVRREPAYWWTVWMTAVAVTAGIVAFGLARGSFVQMLDSFRIWGFIAIVTGSALGLAEFAWPVYLRLAPGRMDLFRYAALGRGTPRVTTYDLRRSGVCVNFAQSMIAIEPPRAPGSPAPALVLSKKWPHFQEHPPGHVPEYLCVALCPGRTEFCQRLIQAARTDEPTPPLPDDRLLG